MQQKNSDKAEFFGERLRVARSQAGLTQAQVAERVQKGAATISDWEKGKSEPSLAEIAKLAEIYRVSAARLAFGFTEEGPRRKPLPVAVTNYIPQEPMGEVIEESSTAIEEKRQQIRAELEEIIRAGGGDIDTLSWILVQLRRTIVLPTGRDRGRDGVLAEAGEHPAVTKIREEAAREDWRRQQALTRGTQPAEGASSEPPARKAGA